MLGLRNLNLLVVEDDHAVARSIQRVLSRHGHSVCVVHGWEPARDQQGHFDAAILDIDLPDGDGVSLAESLLATQRALVVIFFSGTADSELLMRATALGRVVSKAAGFGALERAVLESTAQAAQKAVGAEEQQAADPSKRDTGARLRAPSGTRPKAPRR